MLQRRVPTLWSRRLSMRSRVPTLWSRRLGMRSQDQTQFCSCGFLWLLWPAFLGTVQLLSLVSSCWTTASEEGMAGKAGSVKTLQRLWNLPFMRKTWRPGGTFVRCDGHEGREKWGRPYYEARDTGNSASNSAHILASGKAMTSMPTKAWKQLFLISSGINASRKHNSLLNISICMLGSGVTAHTWSHSSNTMP